MQIDEPILAIAEALPETDGAGPIWLHERPGVWLVVAGRVDIFAVRMDQGQPAGAPRHLFRIEAGQAIFGLDLDGRPEGIALLARGAAGTRMRAITPTALREAARQPANIRQVAAWLDGWVATFSAGIARELIPPKQYAAIEPEQELALDDDQIIRPEQGVVWIKHAQGGSRWIGRDDLPPITGGAPFPLATQTWLQASGACRLRTIGGEICVWDESAWGGLAAFHTLALTCVLRRIEQQEQAERERLQRVAASDQQTVQQALTQLASILETGPAAPAAVDDRLDPLLAACKAVGEALGIAIKAPSRTLADRKQRDPLSSIAKTSRAQVRRVALRGDWWRRDNGPLLAYTEDDRRPVAILPETTRRYRLYDPSTGGTAPLTEELAATLAPFAYTFFRSFPDRAITAAELLRFGLRGGRKDLIAILLTGLAVGFLGLAPPLVTGIIFDSIIPAENQFKLLQLTLALFVAACATALFQLVRGIAILRIEARMSTAIQGAVWDRLLSLPVPFFRQYSAGDLATRVNGLDQIRQLLTGVTISSILVGVFSLFNFALLFYYDVGLALLATLLVLLAFGVTFAAGYIGLRYERDLSVLQARIAGLVLQLVGGIAKLRVAGAESRAFAVWANRFTEQRRVAFRARAAGNGLAVFNAAFPAAASAALFAAIAATGQTGRSTGTVLAFIAAFGGLLAAALTMSTSLLAVLRVIPLFENARPILETAPEVDTSKADPGELSGRIEVSHVSFRYKPDGPPILQDVSIEANPGEFIAVVGPSGSGKSTLFRLLLGFETPESGSIYYDGQDLAELDLQAVRRQSGVVLQNGRLMPGDIFTNIVGSSLLTVDDAWEAAARAGLDEDIRQMPMGIHTVVSESGSTFSGGQRQRLMIARAIVGRPRILLFDEATSALDNRTQAIVSKSLERLQATRLVIAHRLSTIISADRIYVIEAGRVVQRGTYDELAGQAGPFQELIRRQLA